VVGIGRRTGNGDVRRAEVGSERGKGRRADEEREERGRRDD